jgi:class 3 adenylate cyclase
MFACHACRHPLSLASKFCPHCGAPIRGTSLLTKSTPDLRASTRELVGMLSPMQVVTVLVADSAGFAAEYAGSSDMVAETRQTLESLLSDPVGRQGGVSKSAEFGTVALFGVPVAHDDDASRALKAAVDMRGIARSLAAEAAGRLATAPQLTIAITTGIVSAKVGGDLGLDSVLGEALEEVRKLLALAPRGAIAVSDKVRAQAAGPHRFAELAPAQGDGAARPRIFELVDQ